MQLSNAGSESIQKEQMTAVEVCERAVDAAEEAAAAREAIASLVQNLQASSQDVRLQNAAVQAQSTRLEREVTACLACLRSASAKGALPEECATALMQCANHLHSPDCAASDAAAVRAVFHRLCLPHSH